MRQLVIDCQVFQTSSWHRGMGKYSKAFLDGLFADKKFTSEHAVTLIFNAGLPRNEEVVAYIKKQSPKTAIIDVDLEVPKEPRTEHSVQPTIDKNKQVLDIVLLEQLGDKPYEFLILALYLDEVCTAFPSTAAGKLMIYYDAIPYLYHERYGQFKGFFENFYLPHTATVFEATKLLTISKTVANDLSIMFGMPAKRIHNIDGASIPRESSSQDLELNPEWSGEFILMPTGQELRKNNYRAVQAFEQFRLHEQSDAKLIVTSTFTDEAKAELCAISPNVIFTGNVSEGQINALFANSQFILFPSEYEGLGLPVLEAVDLGKPIACSDISVFREISTIAFYYFDPLNIDDMANTLSKLYKDIPTKKELAEHYRPILTKYTWSNTAKHFLEALDAPATKIGNVAKRKVAIFCPEPSGFSAIGKVITESHAWYSQYFDITYYFDKGANHQSIRPNLLSYLAESHDVESFTANDCEKYDALIYHIGNSEYHLNIIHVALAFPGYVILHDTYLNGAFANLHDNGFITEQRNELEQRLDKVLGGDGKTLTSLNLTSIVNNQHAVITHSDYAKKAVAERLLNKDVVIQKINLPVDTPVFEDITRGSSYKVTISFAGIIAKVKGTDIIEKIANSEAFDGSNINIFGYSAVEPERLERLKTLPHVNLVTNPSDHSFQKLMAETDILINVREAYKGETSLTTLEAMRYGVTVFVRDFGWYSELPDNCVVKITNPETTLEDLGNIMQDDAQLADIRRKALDHIKSDYSHHAYALGMYKIITG